MTVHSVFLAGAIDFSTNPKDWRREASFYLAKHDIVCFNPFEAFQVAPPKPNVESAKFITLINNFALSSSNIMLLNAEASLGAGRELGLCEKNKIPVFAFGPKAEDSYTLLSSPVVHLFKCLELALNEIVNRREVGKGVIQSTLA